MSKPLRIVLLGAGRVATHLADRFVAHCRIVQVYSRTATSANALAEKINSKAVISLDEITTDADVYIFSLADDALPEVIARLAPRVSGSLCIHTAGSVPMDVFEGRATHYGVLYPMQTFSKEKKIDWERVPVFIESKQDADMAMIHSLAGLLTPKVYTATSAQRAYLHVGAVLSCNFVNHLYAVTQKLLEAHGLPFEALFPLIEETTEKIKTLAPIQAQTGPAQRGDIRIVETHSKLLSDDPALRQLYDLMSAHIVQYKTEYEHDKL